MFKFMRALKCTPVRPCYLYGVRSQHHEVAQNSGEGFQEIRIPVPWGHIAGKWWGQTDIQPVIGLHGLEDNAGTFDNLAPLLRFSFLTIDFPGHGFSSPIPLGRPYHFMDCVGLLRFITKYFGWDKISLIGHSFGSCVSFIYSALYPNGVENYVSIDCARTLMSPEAKTVGIHLKHTMDIYLSVEKKIGKADPPSYEYDSVLDLLYVGSAKSPSVDSCKILLRRGLNQSPGAADRYYLARDLRLRAHYVDRFSNEFLLKLAPRIKCNHLSFRALQGFVFDDKEEVYLKTLDLIKKQNYKFEFHDIEGTHHVHINNAERLAPIINKFLNC